MLRRTGRKLSQQMTEKHAKDVPSQSQYEGRDSRVVSTGSTLLDLAISGGRFPEGGIPFGVLVEIFGPSGTGKTVLLCQLAGNVQKMDGKVMFHDPEARLNKQFAKMFGLDPDTIEYSIPDTVPQVFRGVREWAARDEGKTACGVFADSLAALSTDMEMGKEEGDKMGMRRAKEFSEELRKTCRIITQQGILMVCSNQVRQNLDAGPYGQRYISPGGEAIGFYSSLRLRCFAPQKIKVRRSVKGKEHERSIGVRSEVEVFKSSIWKPHHTADLYILFDYGIDDIRANLRFIKEMTGDTIYKIGEQKLDKALDQAIQIVEADGLEPMLKAETIALWHVAEAEFTSQRKPRV